MAISLKHLFQSAKADGPDNTIVQPSDWNDEHVLTLNEGKIVGRAAGAGTGAAQELPVSVATDGSTIISGSSSNAMLRITQTGAGNALAVEDSANPDSTPFVIDNDGRVVLGATAIQSVAGVGNWGFQNHAVDAKGNLGNFRWSASALGPQWALLKSRGASVGTQTIVSNGDILGTLSFWGSDGTNFIPAAFIIGVVDGTPGTNDMPGRLVFGTTADGASVSTERMRIDSSGNVGIGTTALGEKLAVNGSVQVGTVTGNLYQKIVDSVSTTASGYYAVYASNGSRLGYFNYYNSTELVVASADGATPLSFRVNGSERVRIDGSGNVGIGTSSPTTWGKLAVVGSSSGGQVVAAIANTAGTANTQAVLSFDTTNNGFNVRDSQIRSTNSGANQTTLEFYTADAAAPQERMRIAASGLTSLTGSFSRGAPVTKTGNFSLAATENWVICNGTGSITVSLPNASNWTGRELTIKTIAAQTVVSNASNVVPLAGGAAGTAILAATAGKFATLVSDGTNWVIMAGN